MQTADQQAPSHPATEASAEGTGHQASGTGSDLPTSALPTSDVRLSLPRAISYRCCEKIQRQAREILEAVSVSARNHYDETSGAYTGREFSPHDAEALFALAHTLLVNVSQGAAGVYAAAGLEVPPEIDWAARGADCGVRGAACGMRSADRRGAADRKPHPALDPSLPHPSIPSDSQAATPPAGLSPSSVDAADGRSLPGAAA